MLEQLQNELREVNRQFLKADTLRKATETTLKGMELEISRILAEQKLLKFKIERAEYAAKWKDGQPKYQTLDGELYEVER